MLHAMKSLTKDHIQCDFTMKKVLNRHLVETESLVVTLTWELGRMGRHSQ